jgi:hypothetical protein
MRFSRSALIAVCLLLTAGTMLAKCKSCGGSCKTGPQGPPGPQGIPGPAFNNFVFAFSNQAQSPVVANTFADITFNSSTFLNWLFPLPGQFQATETGFYLVGYSSTIINNNESDGTVSMRITRNGTEVAGTQTAGQFIGDVGQTINLNKSAVIGLQAGDILVLQFATSLTNPADVVLTPIGNGTTPISVAMTIVRFN